MLDFFKKKIDTAIYAPVKGKCIDISDVKDETFASKVMGDGVAVIPEEGEAVAVGDGTITALFDTGHAFGMELSNGAEILIHIGIDTVNLNGQGFTKLKKQGDRVKKGEPIVRFDLATLKADYDMSTMIIITNGQEYGKTHLEANVDYNTPVLERIV